MTPRLTIVLPLKGRHLFTLRFLWHANRAKMPYRFLIADGQVHPALAALLDKSAKHFPNLDIQYIRYPDDLNYSCFFAKMADALGRVTTPYAMLADNDDFLAFGGLERSIDYLEANADYACSAGPLAGFAVYSGLSNPSGGLLGRLNRLYDYYPGVKDVSSPSAAERVREGGLRLWIYYAVFRTEALAAIGREIAELDFCDLMVHETYHVMRALTLGKAHVDETAISYLRQFSTSQNFSPKNDWVRHFVRSRLTEDIDALVKRVAIAMAKADGIDDAVAAEEIRTMLEAKFRHFFWANYGSFQGPKQALRKRAPRFVAWWQNRPRYFVARQRSAMLRRLASAGASRDYVTRFEAELAAIEDVLTGASFASFIKPHLSVLGV